MKYSQFISDCCDQHQSYIDITHSLTTNTVRVWWSFYNMRQCVLPSNNFSNRRVDLLWSSLPWTAMLTQSDKCSWPWLLLSWILTRLQSHVSQVTELIIVSVSLLFDTTLECLTQDWRHFNNILLILLHTFIISSIHQDFLWRMLSRVGCCL